MSTTQSKSTTSKKSASAAAPVKKATEKAAAPSKKATSKKVVVADAPVAVAPVATPVAAPAPAKKAVAPKKAAAKSAKAAPKKGGAKAAPKAKAAKAAKPAKADKSVAVAADGDEVEGNGKTRFFKVVIGGDETPHGRFSGTKPKQAANKALTSIFKSKEQEGGSITGKVKFSIVECTRGSKHKKYHYVGERVKLDNPMKVTIGKGDTAKVIEYKFNNRVMKDKTVVTA